MPSEGRRPTPDADGPMPDGGCATCRPGRRRDLPDGEPPFLVLIADNHQHFRRGLARVVAAHPGLQVVAEADDGTTALELARRLRPDVALIDMRMPGLDGFEICRLLASAPETRALQLILMTTAPMDALGADGCQMGPLTVLSKDLDRSEFLDAILNAVRLT